MKAAQPPLALPRGSFRSILLIAFEDADIVIEARRRYPDATIDVLTKEHIINRTPVQILRQVRSHSYDLLLISDRASTVLRTDSSIHLLALAVRAPRIQISFSDGRMLSTTRMNLALRTIPSFVAGILAGALLVAFAWCTVLRWRHLKPATSRRAGVLTKGPLTFAYLRTDLAGRLKGGGSLSHMTGFVDALRGLGNRVFFVSDATMAASKERGLVSYRVPASTLLGFFDELQLLHYHYRMIRESRKIFRHEQPDVIYHRHSVLNFSSVVLGSLLNIPVVLEVNYSEVWAKEHWSRLVMKRLARQFERLALSRADYLVVVSSRVRNDIIPLGAPPDRILVNPNGVNPRLFSPDVSGAAVRRRLRGKKSLVVGFVGTFTRWHGVETLLEAIPIVLRHEPSVHFLMIGEGNLKHKMELGVKHAGLERSVTFTGMIPHRDTPQYLAACDILVSPHLGFDDGTPFFGSPTKLFEYMATGKAIIASNLEQLAEVIHDGKNGLLVTPGDARQLARLILKLAHHAALRRHLGARARRDVIAHHTWDINALRVIAALKESNAPRGRENTLS